MTSDTQHPTVVFDCTETVRRLWDFLDRELSHEDMAAIDAHLAACACCPPHFEFEQKFLAAVRAARAQDPTGAGLRARVYAALGRDADGSPATGDRHA